MLYIYNADVIINQVPVTLLNRYVCMYIYFLEKIWLEKHSFSIEYFSQFLATYTALFIHIYFLVSSVGIKMILTKLKTCIFLC